MRLHFHYEPQLLALAYPSGSFLSQFPGDLCREPSTTVHSEVGGSSSKERCGVGFAAGGPGLLIDSFCPRSGGLGLYGEAPEVYETCPHSLITCSTNEERLYKLEFIGLLWL